MTTHTFPGAASTAPSPSTTRRDEADALLAAELRYHAALRHRNGDVTAALHELQRVRGALGLRTHLP